MHSEKDGRRHEKPVSVFLRFPERAVRWTARLRLSEMIQLMWIVSLGSVNAGENVSIFPTFVACGRVIRFARRGVRRPDSVRCTPPLPSGTFFIGKEVWRSFGRYGRPLRHQGLDLRFRPLYMIRQSSVPLLGTKRSPNSPIATLFFLSQATTRPRGAPFQGRLRVFLFAPPPR